jgi:hypothetical protein
MSQHCNVHDLVDLNQCVAPKHFFMGLHQVDYFCVNSETMWLCLVNLKKYVGRGLGLVSQKDTNSYFWGAWYAGEQPQRRISHTSVACMVVRVTNNYGIRRMIWIDYSYLHITPSYTYIQAVPALFTPLQFAVANALGFPLFPLVVSEQRLSTHNCNSLTLRPLHTSLLFTEALFTVHAENSWRM